MTTTPSTGYSPGPFSISSTPTSATCYSPAMGSTAGPGSSRTYLQPRQESPVKTRPQNSRQTTNDSTITATSNGLPARQSSTSSGSTVRAGEGGKSDKPNGSGLPRKSLKNTTMSSAVSSKLRAISPTRRNVTISPEKPREFPELAYLSNAAPLKSTMLPPRPARPVRPSRDGTPDMNFGQTSPVIQSNLSSLPASYHKRQGSSESRKPPAMLSIDTDKPRFAPRKSSSRNPSPSPTVGANASVTSLSTRGVTPEPAELFGKAQPSPQSRFGFFKRKNDSQTSVAAKEKQRLRKPPPVAGTGHEVYGKFGIRGRSGSTTSGATTGSADRRSSSFDSSQRTLPSSRKNSLGSRRGSETDDFVADRLTPVTLRGTGPVPAAPAAVGAMESGRRPEDRRPGTALGSSIVGNPATGLSSKPQFHHPVYERTDNSSSVPRIDVPAQELKGGRFGLSSLSARRSSRRSMIESKPSSLSSPVDGEFHFPAHPATDPLERKMSEPSVTFRPSTDSRQPSAAQPLQMTNPKSAKKWNFFQRTKTPIKKADSPMESLAIAPPSQLPPRQLPHYALMDAPSKVDMEELEQIMLEAEDQSPDELPQQEEEPEEGEDHGRLDARATMRHGNSMLLPAPPQLLPRFMPARPDSPRVMLRPALIEPQPVQQQSPPSPAALPTFRFRPDDGIETNEPEPPTGLAALPKGSRLPQVGRIPRVVSRRDREKKPSISSFSRPFDASQPSPAMQAGSFNEEYPSDGLQPPQSTPTPTSPLSGIDDAPNYFESLHSSASFSNGHSSSEEVWNEYDDLLDLLSPITPKTPRSSSSLGAPFHYTQLASPAQEAYTPVLPPPVEVPSVPSIIRRVRFPSTRESQILAAGSNVLVTTPTCPRIQPQQRQPVESVCRQSVSATVLDSVCRHPSGPSLDCIISRRPTL